MVGEGGREAVSDREAARRAGVSPGAPFRHFPSRDALMQAVAGEAQRRFRPRSRRRWPRRRPAIRSAAFAASGSPTCAGRCATRPISRSFSSRRFFDHDRAVAISRDKCVIDLTERTWRTLCGGGSCDQLTSSRSDRRAGRWSMAFARLNNDGHFPPLGGGRPEAERTAEGHPRSLHRGFSKRA
jgi:AcrR family transcriptional regulator